MTMVTTISAKELKEQRCEVAAEMQKLYDSAEGEKRAFTTEEQEKWDGFKAKCDELAKRAKAAEDFETVQSTKFSDSSERESFEKLKEDRGQKFEKDDPNRPLTQFERNQEFRFRMAFNQDYEGRDEDQKVFERAQKLRGRSIGEVNNKQIEMRIDRGRDASGAEFRAPRSVAESRAQAKARSEQLLEKRVQLVGTATAGGHTVPDETMRELDDARLHFGGMRQCADILSTATGASLPIPTANDTNNEGEIIAENAEANAQDVAFGQVTLGAFKVSSKIIAISMELLQDSATNMAAYIGRKAGERIGRYENRVATVGVGTTEPFGIVTGAANSGVTTAAATAIQWTELNSLIHSVDIAYRDMGAKFMLGDPSLLLVKNVKTVDGLPVWQPSMTVGEPDRICGYPYQVNNHMPSGTGAKAVIFGALNKYLLREVLNFTLIRLDERYAEFGRVAFLAWARMDGRLIDAGTGPVKYLTLA